MVFYGGYIGGIALLIISISYLVNLFELQLLLGLVVGIGGAAAAVTLMVVSHMGERYIAKRCIKMYLRQSSTVMVT